MAHSKKHIFDQIDLCVICIEDLSRILILAVSLFVLLIGLESLAASEIFISSFRCRTHTVKYTFSNRH